MIDKKAVTDRFSRKADIYDFVTPVQDQMAAELLRYIDCLSPAKINSILEIGCGTGRVTEKLSDRYPDVEITAFDISDEMVKRAKNRYPNGHFFVADAENLCNTFNRKFDLIVSNATFQWFHNPIETTMKYYDLLNTDGNLIINTFGDKTFNELKISFEYAYQILKVPPRHHVTHMLSAEEWGHYFTDAIIDEQIYIEKFRTVRDFLRSIQNAGATNSVYDVKPIMKEVYQKMMNKYVSDFSQNGKGIQATYQAIRIHLNKCSDS